VERLPKSMCCCLWYQRSAWRPPQYTLTSLCQPWMMNLGWTDFIRASSRYCRVGQPRARLHLTASFVRQTRIARAPLSHSYLTFLAYFGGLGKVDLRHRLQVIGEQALILCANHHLFLRRLHRMNVHRYVRQPWSITPRPGASYSWDSSCRLL